MALAGDGAPGPIMKLLVRSQPDLGTLAREDALDGPLTWSEGSLAPGRPTSAGGKARRKEETMNTTDAGGMKPLLFPDDLQF